MQLCIQYHKNRNRKYCTLSIDRKSFQIEIKSTLEEFNSENYTTDLLKAIPQHNYTSSTSLNTN